MPLKLPAGLTMQALSGGGGKCKNYKEDLSPYAHQSLPHMYLLLLSK